MQKKFVEHSELQDKICKIITIKEFASYCPGFDVKFRPSFSMFGNLMTCIVTWNLRQCNILDEVVIIQAFDDYNNNHIHSAFGYRTPSEFYRILEARNK